MLKDKVVLFMETNFKKVYLEKKLEEKIQDKGEFARGVTKLQNKISSYKSICESVLNDVSTEEYNRTIEDHDLVLSQQRQFELISQLGYKLPRI